MAGALSPIETQESGDEKQFSKDLRSSWPICLHTAASLGCLSQVNAILSRKENSVNKQNLGSWTPLMYAAYYGHDVVASRLIVAGAHINQSNRRGQTSLMFASMCGHLTLVQLILENCDLVDAPDDDGMNALFYATYSGYTGVVEVLLRSGANPNLIEKRFGLSPLLLAAAEGSDVIVKMLLSKGANINHKTYNGNNAWSLATAGHHSNVIAILDAYLPHNSCVSSIFARSLNLHNVGGMTSSALSPTICGNFGSSDYDYSRSQNNLAVFLEKLGLSKYLSVFEERNIDFPVFLKLSDADLQNIGIKLLGPRRKMCNAIKSWQTCAVQSKCELVNANVFAVDFPIPALQVSPANQEIHNLQMAFAGLFGAEQVVSSQHISQ